MKALSTAHRWTLLCLVLLICPALALGQSSDISVEATAKKGSIELSESVRITLSVEGPAPLRVELSKQLLVPESDRDWKIQPVAPSSIAPLGENRERWVQVFRLDPYVFGNSLVVLFAPLKVNGREVPGPGWEVTVNEPKVEMKASASMGVTRIEELPAPPEAPPGSLRWWWVGGAILVLAVVIVVWRLRPQSKPVPPREWALRAFAKLERNRALGMPMVEGVSSGLRGFIERQFGLPAPRLTTEELLAAAEQAPWPIEHADPLRLLLDECDRAKFAGDIPDDDGCRRLLVRARDWVNLICPDTGPG